MSTLLQGLRFTSRSLRHPPILHRCAIKPIGPRRPFSSTIAMRDEDPELENAVQKINQSAGGRRKYLERQMEEMMEEQEEDDEEDEDDMMDDIEDIMGEWDEEFDALSDPPPTRGKQQVSDSFFNYGENNDEDGPMELDDEGDDEAGEDDYTNMTVLAHGELQQHQEIRHYARLAAWDLPLLSKLAKPFEPPTADMPLRFRYTTYMGEAHPAEKKVVVEFCIRDMPGLTKIQRDKLKKLTGVRYNPETDIVKMSCEMYESQAQNKRYLGDRVDELVKEAKDPTDTFQDIPLNLTHHKIKTRPKWPKHWSLTPERKAELAQYRQNSLLTDEKRIKNGLLIDGNQAIELAMAEKKALADAALPAMEMAGRGKGRMVGMRRV